MEKVKLPREVAEAIEKVWGEHGGLHSKHMTLNNWNYLSDNYHISVNVLRPYAENHPMEYMQALVNGYEVEETPEDKVKKYFLSTKENLINPKAYYGNEAKCEAIIHVLDLLNIKIEGVNA